MAGVGHQGVDDNVALAVHGNARSEDDIPSERERAEGGGVTLVVGREGEGKVSGRVGGEGSDGEAKERDGGVVGGGLAHVGSWAA